uniref:Uncharacterized protein n=1 Tax=Caenorhabditis japonica TaxID=281687 RepID=A0A8R1IB18_CAEJA
MRTKLARISRLRSSLSQRAEVSCWRRKTSNHSAAGFLFSQSHQSIIFNCRSKVFTSKLNKLTKKYKIALKFC